MGSSNARLNEQESNLASTVSAIQRVALVLLLVIFIFVAHWGDQSNGPGGRNCKPLALGRRNGIGGTFTTQLPTLDHRLGRSLLENGQANGSTTNERPLAVKKDRLDPFNHFRKYRGGYNVQSKRYWGSLAVTGLPGYAIAVGWLVLGFLLVLSICCARCCCNRKRSILTDPAAAPYNVLHLLVTIFIALATLAAIGGCIVLYVGGSEFTAEARKVDHALQNAAANASGTIDALAAAIGDVSQILEPFGNGTIISITGISVDRLNSTQETLSGESRNINHVIHKNTRILDDVITALEVVFIVVASLNLILIILATVLVLLHWKQSSYLILTAAWILTVLIAFLLGISIVEDNLVADTCDAMNEYLEDPYNTTLDSLIPCQDLLSASNAFTSVGQGIRNSLTQVNKTLIQFEGPLNSTLPVLCEPIGPAPSYQYNGSCPNGTVPISQLPQVLEIFHCATNNSQACSQQGQFLTDFEYMELVAYANGVQTLLNIYPSIGGLTNCSIVTQTFDTLLQHNCGPLKAAGELVWDAFLCLVISMVPLIVSWLVLTCYRERKTTVIFPVAGSPKKRKS